MLLAHEDVIDTLVQLLRGGLGVGDLVTAANLLPQALLEVGLGSLVVLDFAAEVAAGDVELGLDAGVAGAGGLLDLLEEIAEVAETVVDLILDVIQALVGDLILLGGVGVEQSVLGGGELTLSLGTEVGNAIVDLSALVQEGSRVGGLLLTHLVHLYIARVSGNDGTG